MLLRSYICCILFFVLTLVQSQTALSGEHPRLLFDAKHVAKIRADLPENPFLQLTHKNLLIQLKEMDEAEEKNPCRDNRARVLACLYILTGEKAYAERAGQLARAICEDEEIYNDHKSKGLVRAAGAYTLVVAYDLCHDAWDEELRKLVSGKLYEGADAMVRSMGRYANVQIANNWQGVRYAVSGMAYLICDNQSDAREKAREAYEKLMRHIWTNYGSNGWCPEGIGYVQYPWSYIGPFGVAAERAGIGDLRKDKPVTRKILWPTLVGTVSIPTEESGGMRADLTDDNPHFDAYGQVTMGMWYAPESEHDAIRWMHKYLMPHHTDIDRGGAVAALTFYESIMHPGKNPGTERLNYLDKSDALVIFRNRFQDRNDCVVLVNGHARQPRGCHDGPDTNTFRVLGLGSVWVVGSGRTSDPRGQTNLFPGEPPQRAPGGLGKLISHEFDGTGGGETITAGSCMGVKDHKRQMLVDYSKKSQAEALIVSTETSANGKVWRLNLPEFHTISSEGDRFTLTSPDGAKLTAIVIHPAAPAFRTGDFVRGGASGVTYDKKRYMKNKWIEFEVENEVCVVMLLHRGDAPPVSIDRVLHGAAGTIGEQSFVWNRQAGLSMIGAEAAESDVATRAIPLQPRRVHVASVKEDRVDLGWRMPLAGAEEILVQRKSGEESFTTIDTLTSDAAQYTDTSVAPATAYTYRLVTRNATGESEPSQSVPVRTWDTGTREVVEDFGATGNAEDDTIGGWISIPNTRRGFLQTLREIGKKHNRTKEAYMATPNMPIRSTRAFYTEAISGDFSDESAEIRYDVKAQAVTVFGLLLKLADGRWVTGGKRHVHGARHLWRTQVFQPALIEEWTEIDPESGNTKGEAFALEAEDLTDIRGVGVHANWVINSKWASVDRIHVRGKSLSITE